MHLLLLLCSLAFASEADSLKRLMDSDWKFKMTEYPEWATFNGYPGQNDRWTDLSPESIERRKRHSAEVLKALRGLQKNSLKASDRLNYELFLHEIELEVEGEKFPDELIPVSQMDGIQRTIGDIFESMPAEKKKDFEDMAPRLERLPKALSQTTDLMRKGLEKGLTPPKITLRDVPDQVEKLLKGPMLGPLEKLDAADPIRVRANRAFREKVVPALENFRDFLIKEYIPRSREEIGLSTLPDGKAWYAFKARYHTTTTLSPDQIHEIGKNEVARIRKEMDEVVASTKFKGDFSEFKKFLRTDSRFFFESAEELVRAYRDIAKRIDPELPKLFGKLPRLTYGVKPVPAFSEKSQTTAYYMPGSPPAGRPGYFFANTYDLKMRPKWEMEALTPHEAVPGHHFQIALAQEMENVPDFRRYGISATAFVEGWGLYAESLGKEIGLYQDPYSHFGQLTYEMWRAIRLVVDTGIHSKGWTRDQAIKYFTENSAKTEHDIEVEVDRYIVMPGQALAYKIGELKFKELRAQAAKRLGERFNIRSLHDQFLKNGAIPLDVLEAQFKRWLDLAATAKQER